MSSDGDPGRRSFVLCLLDRVSDCVKEFVGRSMLPSVPPDPIFVHDACLLPAYNLFHSLTYRKLRPIPRDSLNWWIVRYHMLTWKLPTLLSNYVQPLRNIMRGMIDGDLNMRYREIEGSGWYFCGVDEPRFFVIRQTGDDLTFLDRLANVLDVNYRCYDITRDEMPIKMLSAVCEDEGISDLLIHIASEFDTPRTMLSIVHNMAGDYSDSQRLVTYGMVMYALLLVRELNKNRDFHHYIPRRPPMKYFELLMQFFCAHPEFVEGIYFKCRKSTTAYGMTYIRFHVHILQHGQHALTHIDIFNVPKLNVKSMFKNFIDANVRTLKKQIGPAPPAKRPKPVITTGQAPTTRSRAAAQSSLNASI